MRTVTRQKKREIERIRLEEAADAVIWVLEENDKRFPESALKKDAIYQRIPEAIHRLRENHGHRYIPTIENEEVKVADMAFIKRRWKDITLLCANNGYYIVWNCKALGIRLGTVDEYMQQQSLLVGITDGFAKYHNQRAEAIVEAGKPAADVKVRVMGRIP